jgi:hypothetical protein
MGVALAQHYTTQLLSPQNNEDFVPAICNEWFTFKFFGKVKKLKEILEFSLPSDDGFAVLWQL